MKHANDAALILLLFIVLGGHALLGIVSGCVAVAYMYLAAVPTMPTDPMASFQMCWMLSFLLITWSLIGIFSDNKRPLWWNGRYSIQGKRFGRPFWIALVCCALPVLFNGASGVCNFFGFTDMGFYLYAGRIASVPLFLHFVALYCLHKRLNGLRDVDDQPCGA